METITDKGKMTCTCT